MNLRILGLLGYIVFTYIGWTANVHAQQPLSNSPQTLVASYPIGDNNPIPAPSSQVTRPVDAFKADPIPEDSDTRDSALSALESVLESPHSLTDRRRLLGNLQVILTVSVLSLAPAILLMTTCYVRIVVVLGLLRQALGTGQLPSTQILTSIAIFMTVFVMTPVWNRVYQDAIKPYTAEGTTMTSEEAWLAGSAPIREFMMNQIAMAGNQDDVKLFYRSEAGQSVPQYLDEVPLHVLLPAFMLSELKVAFLMGFMIFLPFLVIDLVVAAVTVSMGMMMLPPSLISLPFKLLLFVMVDGFTLVVGMLLQSFG